MSKQNQTKEQIKSDAIVEFVSSMIASLESGFVNHNTLTLSEIHRVSENYCKDKYGVTIPTLVDQWGKDVANMCGLNQSEITNSNKIVELKHELSELEVKTKKMYDALLALVGAETKKELDYMELYIRNSTQTKSEKTIIINAINAIRLMQ